MAVDEIDVVLQPVGRTPGVLEPPLAKYQPQFVVLFTSEQKYADMAIEHIEHSWKKHVHRTPEVIVKIVEDPWTADTVDRYMYAFDEAVKELENRESNKNKNINWHVGTAGGTNPMAIASALSAFTHRFSVFYSLDSAHNPKKDTKDLAIEIDLFTNLGPGFKALQKVRAMKIMKFIAKNGPVRTDAIIKHLQGTKQNESAGRKPLREACLIVEDENGWVATNLARSLLAMMDYEEE